MAAEANGSNRIEMQAICKYFTGVKALDNVSLTAQSGYVYAIVGENGAGKSTLLKIMNGDYTMTSGRMLLNGAQQNFTAPKDAIDAGISVIYQERQIVANMTVAENVFLGNWLRKKSGLVDYDGMAAQAKRIIDEFGLPIDPNEKVKNLSAAYQQMVEIMKAYARNAKVIAFDEPTASLTDAEIEVLFRIIKKMKAENKIIFYVSHRMKEISEIADKIIVFKDGVLVGSVDCGAVTMNELVKMMVGRDLGDIFKAVSYTHLTLPTIA